MSAKIGILSAGLAVAGTSTFVVVLSQQAAAFAGGPSALALRDIPSHYLQLSVAAAPTCPGLSWGVLAAIGKIESDHGRSDLLGVHSGANPAGAQGPMQLLPATFTAYAVDGDGDGRLDVYGPADAVFTAARYLCANGAGQHGHLRTAVFRYSGGATLIPFWPGQRSTCSLGRQVCWQHPVLASVRRTAASVPLAAWPW